MEEIIKIFTEQGEKLNDWQMVIRGLLVFIMTIVIVRLGKRKFLGKNSALDIILAVIIGSVASRAINGSGYLFSTLLSIGFLVACHWFLSYISFKSGKIASFLEGEGFPLMKGGKLDEKAMLIQLFRKEELLEAARLRGNISDLSKVEEAYLESNGSISVIKKDEKRIS
jgi:uncharacterized membrane protein YcaP (DUF421 family)